MPELAGKTCLEAEGMIKDRLGTHEVKVAVIGAGRREPRALRLRQRRLVAQRRPHRHGRGHGLEEPQGDRRPRQQGPARARPAAA